MKLNQIQKWIKAGVGHPQVVAYMPSTLERLREAVQEGVLNEPLYQRTGENSFQIRQYATLPIIVHPENLAGALAKLESERSKVLYGQILLDRANIADTLREVDFTIPKTTAEAILMINEGLAESGQHTISWVSDPPDSLPSTFNLSLLNMIRSAKQDKNEANRRILLPDSQRLKALHEKGKRDMQQFNGNQSDPIILRSLYHFALNALSEIRGNSAAIIGFNSRILEFEAHKDPNGPLDTVHVRIPKEGFPLNVIEGLEKA